MPRREGAAGSNGWLLISQTVALRIVRATLTAWAVSSYVKASMLTRRSRAITLFRSPMTRSLRQMLTAYHLLVFYVMVRMLGAGTSRWLFISLPGLLTRRLPNTHAICAAVLAGTVAVDELVHAFATASVNHTRSLVGNPCAKSAEPLQCCICHETDEDGEQLYDFCSSAAHPAHATCMTKWYLSGRWASSTCPVCRQPLATRRRSLYDRVQTSAAQPLFWLYAARRTAVTVGVAAAFAAVLQVLIPRLQSPPQGRAAADSLARLPSVSTLGRQPLPPT
eukprot:m.461149 g.461149  ORF g.461149 m.461149 type:complete len:279 (+) comp22226_c0_seq1:138-974(+)